jgi:hypothetical protein
MVASHDQRATAPLVSRTRSGLAHCRCAATTTSLPAKRKTGTLMPEKSIATVQISLNK